MGRLVSAYQLIQVIADLSFGNHAITSAWNNIWSLLFNKIAFVLFVARQTIIFPYFDQAQNLFNNSP